MQIKKKGSASSHGAPLGQEELQFVKSQIEWTKNHSEFEIPTEILNEWRKLGAKCDLEAEQWNAKYLNFLNKFRNNTDYLDEIKKIKFEYSNFNKDESTRKSSGNFLEKSFHMLRKSLVALRI